MLIVVWRPPQALLQHSSAPGQVPQLPPSLAAAGVEATSQMLATWAAAVGVNLLYAHATAEWWCGVCQTLPQATLPAAWLCLCWLANSGAGGAAAEAVALLLLLVEGVQQRQQQLQQEEEQLAFGGSAARRAVDGTDTGQQQQQPQELLQQHLAFEGVAVGRVLDGNDAQQGRLLGSDVHHEHEPMVLEGDLLGDDMHQEQHLQHERREQEHLELGQGFIACDAQQQRGPQLQLGHERLTLPVGRQEHLGLGEGLDAPSEPGSDLSDSLAND